MVARISAKLSDFAIILQQNHSLVTGSLRKNVFLSLSSHNF